MDTRTIRVVLADDHRVVAEGLARLLSEHFTLVASVGNGRELIAAVEEQRPDVALVDVSMPNLNGIEAVRALAARFPDTRQIMLTMHADPEYIRAALNAGARGYVLKRVAGQELIKAIEAVMDGSVYLSETLAMPASLSDENGVLTSRQREVLQLIAEGFSAKQIAGELHISVKTVEFHKTRLLERVGARTTADLIRYAVEHGMTVKN